MRNPVLIELTRGALVESVHAGALAVVQAGGMLVSAVGSVTAPIFPRSAIKPLQAIPFVETGAADRFGFGAPEIALSCASHTGTPAHAALARSMLQRTGLSPEALACGVHEPMDTPTARAMIRQGAAPTALNHNCSGKHSGMLATAVHNEEPTEGYWRPDHPVQMRIACVLEDLAGCRLSPDACGIDGCSVPNWAMPLAALAQAFACLATGQGLNAERALTCRRIVQACWTHPDLVAGPGRLVTQAMERLPGKVLLKSGAEGVCCGALPERGLGFAIKIDDGAQRAAEAVAAQLIGRFHPEIASLGPPAQLTNWRGAEVGQLRLADTLRREIDGLRP